MRIRNIAVIVVAVALCIGCGTIAYGLMLQAHTRNVIEASDMISLRTLGEVSAKVGNLKLSGCQGEHCVYDVAVNNRLFSGLHLANYTELRATYYFDHGARILSVMDYRIAVPRGNSPVVHVQDDGQADELWNELFGVNPHGPRSNESWNGALEFNASTPEAKRRAARSFNLRCFLPFNHCTDISDLLPAIWSRNSDRSIRCKFRTSGDAIGEWERD